MTIKLDCNECKKKPTCVTLCKKAEKYANQDYVELQETLGGELSKRGEKELVRELLT